MADIEFDFIGTFSTGGGSDLYSAKRGVVAFSCDLSSARDGTAESKTITLSEGDVIELDTDYGSWVVSRHQLLAMTRLGEDGYPLGESADSRGNTRDPGNPQLPSVVHIDDGTRGFFTWVLKVFRVLKIDLIEFAFEKISKINIRGLNLQFSHLYSPTPSFDDLN